MTDYNRLGVKYMIKCNDGMTTIVYTGDGKSVRQLPFGVTMPFTVKEIKQINRFEELRKLAEAAIPGPWINGDDEDSGYCLVGPHDGDGIVFQPVVKLHNETNAEYIAAANPQTILAMLDLIELQYEALQESAYACTSKSEEITQKAFDAYNKFGNHFGDQATLRDCATKGIAKLQGGGTIKCEVVKDKEQA